MPMGLSFGLDFARIRTDHDNLGMRFDIGGGASVVEIACVKHTILQ